MQILIYNFLSKILSEDAEYDKNVRIITRKILEDIRNFLLRHMSTEEIVQLMSSLGSGNPIATNSKTPILQRNFTTNDDNVSFVKIITDLGDLTFGIDLGNFIRDDGGYNKNKNLLIIKGISKDGIMRIQDIRHLFLREDTVIHELIHAKDTERVKNSYKSVQYDKIKNNEKEYFNSSKEYNAWSQEIFDYLETYIISQQDLPERITSDWFEDFIKDIFEKRSKSNRKLQTYKVFIDSLTPKNRNRFYNRLYNNLIEIWKPELSKTKD